MSGHSKWSKIKRAKGAADAKKGALFTKLGKNIAVATREGGGNPGSNFKLKLAIDKAKQANMPKENVERAIKRGTGELAGAAIESITYEAFGPGGVAFIIETLTDNKKRTVADIKHILTKHGGSLGGPNSVLWMFERKGVIRIEEVGENKDEIELKAIELGAEDIVEEEGLIIYTQPNDLQKIKEGLETAGINVEYAEIELVSKEKVKVEDPKIADKIEKLSEELDECDDVDDYFTNSVD